MSYFFISHYCVFLQVKTDSVGRMDVMDLRSKISEARKKGCVPYFVNATSGTTVMSAFDPLDQIASVCKEENIWLHVDVSDLQ